MRETRKGTGSACSSSRRKKLNCLCLDVWAGISIHGRIQPDVQHRSLKPKPGTRKENGNVLTFAPLTMDQWVGGCKDWRTFQYPLVLVRRRRVRIDALLQDLSLTLAHKLSRGMGDACLNRLSLMPYLFSPVSLLYPASQHPSHAADRHATGTTAGHGPESEAATEAEEE